MYTIAKVSDILGISKQAVYKKINQLENELKNCISKNGKTLINEKGLKILKINTIGLNENETSLNQFNCVDEKFNNLVETISDQVDFLKKEIEAKNVQIDNKDKQLEKKDKLIENMQVLLKQNQEIYQQSLMIQNNDKPLRKRIFNFFKIK